MAETWKQRLRRRANAALNPLGFHVTRKERAFEMSGLIERAARRGFAPATVIDVGASDGQWSLAARRVFSQAQFILFEPLVEHAAALAATRERHGFIVVPAAAGTTRGSVAFHVTDELDGSGIASGGAAAGTREVPVESVDDVLADRRSSGPYCLKLDTHGYEIPVLAGATRVLGADGLIVIEAYNFQLTAGSLRFHELCGWMEQRGWRCCDLADPMRRPGDGMLWQMDLAFAPIGSPWFASNAYR